MHSFLLTALLALGMLASLTAPRGGIHSHLLVEPGNQFVLGGDQAGGFRVAAHNTGPVAVALRERLQAGTVVERGTLAPGQRALLVFGRGSAALVCNTNTRQAMLELDISGGQPGRMYNKPTSAE